MCSCPSPPQAEEQEMGWWLWTPVVVSQGQKHTLQCGVEADQTEKALGYPMLPLLHMLGKIGL